MTDIRSNLQFAGPLNRILMGLVFLAGGLVKLFVMQPAGLTKMLGSIGMPLPAVAAWVLIIAEIVSGSLIIANRYLEYAIWPPVVILLVAAFTFYPTKFADKLPLMLTQIGIHLVLTANALAIGAGLLEKRE